MNVFITVDTEHSIGGAFQHPELKPVGNRRRIYGYIGAKAFGIPLIMEIADRWGIALTFFLEVLNKAYFGENETKEVCHYILDRKYDVQLHLHPNYLNFAKSPQSELRFSDRLSQYKLKQQVELIREGKELLTKYGAPPPIAFRAGNYAANKATLKALKANGFLIDSSYNRSCSESFIENSFAEINDLAHMENIWEFPITNFIESLPLRKKRTKPLDLNGVSFEEIRHTLEQAKLKGMTQITIILHSFSFIKTYDLQYTRVKPRRRAIRRFEKLCKFLHDNSVSFRTKTFGSLKEEELIQTIPISPHFFPKVPPMASIRRLAHQIADRLL